MDVVKPFDWSYSTDYKGTVTGDPLEDGAEAIPIELLKRPDPIEFFEEVVLYESELDDNGISIFSVKVRVMPERMLLLCRLFMRLDNVIFRIRDTRVYVDFRKARVLREYSALEESWDKVEKVRFAEWRTKKDGTDFHCRNFYNQEDSKRTLQLLCGIPIRLLDSFQESHIPWRVSL
jgi:hypothetical protein